jgi:hypothetical protein
MLDTIVKLLEKLIKFGEVRETNKQRYVDRYVTPLYLAAETIYKDYSSLLRTLRRKIQTGRKTISLVTFLEQRRLDQLPTRVKIREILRRTPEKNWTRFEQGILGLINGCLSDSESHTSIYPVESGFTGLSGHHTVYDIARRIEYNETPDLAPVRSRLLEAVEIQIAGIDKAWEFVCAGYADLQRTTFSDLSVPAPYRYRREGD